MKKKNILMIMTGIMVLVLFTSICPMEHTISYGIGKSMFPTFWSGVNMLCLKLPYQTGDIIKFSYIHSERYDHIAHRMTGIEHGKIVTKGDFNSHVEYIDPEDVVCKVVTWW